MGPFIHANGAPTIEPERSSTGSLPPTRIGKYKVIDFLGRGGMSEVYLAEDTVLNRRVALKWMGTEPEAHGALSYLTEARAAAAVSHPNVAHIYEVGELDGRPFIAMEYVQGTSLEEIRRQGPSHPNRVVELGMQIADGLHAAHTRDIIHRDIKPSNLLVTGLRVKILDFGLAQTATPFPRGVDLDADSPLKTHGSRAASGQERIMGTPAYMSPEQVSALPLDGRSDIFSLGIVLHELLTGTPLFLGRNSAESMLRVVRDSPPPLADHLPEVSPDLERVLLRCLEKDPEDRFPCAQSLCEELYELSPTASTSSAVRPVPKPVQRKPGILRRVLRSLAHRGKRNRKLAVMPFEIRSGPSREASFLADGLAEGLIHRLSRLHGLSVISRTSAFHAGNRDPDELVHALDVDVLVTGRITQAGHEVEVAVELTDARSGLHLWGEHFRRGWANLFELQALLAAQIADELQVELVGSERQRLEQVTATDSKAYRLYLQGLYHWHRAGNESSIQAASYFRRAIAQDPGFALAHAGIAMAHGVTLGDSIMEPRVAVPIAIEAAHKALGFDPSLAEAQTVLGAAELWYHWNPAGAEHLLKKAIALNPGYAVAHHQYGWLLALTGRLGEAAAELDKALELDPLSLAIATDTNLPYSIGGRLDEALQRCLGAMELDPDFFLPHFVAGWIHTLDRDPAGALPFFEKARRLDDSPLITSWLGHTYAVLGREVVAKERLRELVHLAESRYVAPVRRALVHAGLGDLDAVFDALGDAVQARDWGILWLDIEPAYDQARQDPRWHSLIARRNLVTATRASIDEMP